MQPRSPQKTAAGLEPSEPGRRPRAQKPVGQPGLTADEAALARRLSPVMANPVTRARDDTAGPRPVRLGPPDETAAIVPPLPDFADATQADGAMEFDALDRHERFDETPVQTTPVAVPRWLKPARPSRRARTVVGLSWLLTVAVIAVAILAACIAFLGSERVAGAAAEFGDWLAIAGAWVLNALADLFHLDGRH